MNIKKRPLAEINIVPYIDVMLVLLVIFMITTPMLTQGVKVSLPEVGGEKIKTLDNRQPYVVSLTKEGQYTISHGETFVNLSQLEDVMKRMSAYLMLDQKEKQRAQVLVRADKDVSYEKVLALMSILQKSGAKTLGLLSSPMNEDSKNNHEKV